MNKLIMIPLSILLILSAITFVSGGYLSSGTVDVQDGGTINVNGSAGTVNVPNAGEQSFYIWGLEGAIVILVAAMALAIVSGITVFGSGLGEGAQRMIFLTTALFGLWICLSVINTQLILSIGVAGSLLWLLLTIMYVLGFVQTFMGGDSDD